MLNSAATASPGHGLAALELRVAEDLRNLNYPARSWVPSRAPVDNKDVQDVVVIGAGMCGLVAAFALKIAGISRFRIIDRNPAGLEGPWLTYARMETLRSPKDLVGPACGIGSLTFRAWYEASFGLQAWDDLYRIPRAVWMDYLVWFRDVLGLPVENGFEVSSIGPGERDLVAVDFADGRPSIQARKIVLATGRDGVGGPAIPSFVEGLPKAVWAHTTEMIDFSALAGKRVAVVGVGASAMDNAATALESGASEVRLLARRPVMPCVNKLMGIGSYGLSAGFSALDDNWKWRISEYAMRQQTPAPRSSVLRVSRYGNSSFHFGQGIESITLQGHELDIRTTAGASIKTDFLILGTGFEVNLDTRPELNNIARNVARWRDRFEAPKGMEAADLYRHPYLNSDFSFREKTPNSAPWVGNIYCFNHAAALSMGKLSSDIPAISEGAQLLAKSISEAFYVEDIEHHWGLLENYEEPELFGDEWIGSEI